MERPRGSTGPVVALYGLFMAATVGGFCFLDWKLDVATEHGRGVDAMILFLLVATGAMFVAGHAIVGWFLLTSSRAGAPAWKAPSSRGEWLATLAPVVVVAIVAEGGVLAIGMPVWAQMAGRDPDAFAVEVIGRQFEWVGHYPGKDGKFGRLDPAQVDDQLNPIGLDEEDPAAADDLVTRGGLTLPAGRTASIRLRSLDVLHSFAVPLFRTKQDLVPGLVTRTQLKPIRPGKFEIACAELCGLGHYRMRGWATVLEPAEFEAWLARQTPFGE